MGFCKCSMVCCTFLYLSSSFPIILIGKRAGCFAYFVFFVVRDCCVALPCGAMGKSADCDCGIFLIILTILESGSSFQVLGQLIRFSLL